MSKIYIELKDGMIINAFSENKPVDDIIIVDYDCESIPDDLLSEINGTTASVWEIDVLPKVR